MKITVRQRSKHPPDGAFRLLQRTIREHPGAQGITVNWGDRRGEGEYLGARLEMRVEGNPDGSEITVMVSGPTLLLKPLERAIESEIREFLTAAV